jgi:hypothetical protein
MKNKKNIPVEFENELNNLLDLASPNEIISKLESMYIGFIGSEYCSETTSREREDVYLICQQLKTLFQKINAY